MFVMQTKPTRNVLRAAKWTAIWSTAIIGLAASASAAPYRAYLGPVLQRTQVAVLNLSHIQVAAVDGKSTLFYWDGSPRTHPTAASILGLAKPLPLNPPGSIELLPGQHKITFFFGYSPLGGHAYLNSTTIIQDIVVEAGKTYKAQRRIQYSGGRTTVSGRTISSTANIDKWWVEITEK